MTGGALASTAGIGTASAASGYGAGGYGEGEYGGGSSTDTAVSVTTGSASNGGTDSVTLAGELTDLGGVDSADTGFQYRQAGASSWQSTSTETLSSTGTYSRSLSGLQSGTEYEYRATATASDGDTDTGTVQTVTTASAPSIDRFVVSEAGSPNPHADITAEWDVSDADADLSSVLVQVLDADGAVVDESRTNVSGDVASGKDTFKVKHASGATFDVTVLVVDGAGHEATASRTVTE